jgi:hypothetical protein
VTEREEGSGRGMIMGLTNKRDGKRILLKEKEIKL